LTLSALLYFPTRRSSDLALKYGERDTTACQFFYREASHAPITLHYYVWLILGGPHPILVDTGFLDDDARERGIRNYVSPAAVVADRKSTRLNSSHDQISY